MQIGPQGLVHITIDELYATTLQHLTSGLDEDIDRSAADCGSVACLTGYTEWLSPDEPCVVMGWDWLGVFDQATPRLERIGAPRCNLQLHDAQQRALSWEQQNELLEQMIDAMAWEDSTRAAILDRYR